MEIDPKTGLPLGAIEWEDLAKSSQRIKVTTDKKRYGKIVTVVSGFDNGIDVRKTAKALKNELACGGTYKDGVIELQGYHVKKIKPLLIKLGFEEESIQE
ncbi:MAG: stress response translation initiation inhibitor YciH [Nanoarchaeota archaeon]|nr:stress response translation initiation inhibitor YciH [Nanoarchaeota archaeon]MBU4308418.1 stress response translation initiation inhibitor YciH [Nanoarchaeota archaeon]